MVNDRRRDIILAHVENPRPDSRVRLPSRALALTLAVPSLCTPRTLAIFFSSVVSVAGQDGSSGQSETEKRAVTGNGSLTVFEQRSHPGECKPLSCKI